MTQHDFELTPLRLFVDTGEYKDPVEFFVCVSIPRGKLMQVPRFLAEKSERISSGVESKIDGQTLEAQMGKVLRCINLLEISEDRIADAVTSPEADKLSSLVTAVRNALFSHICFLEELNRKEIPNESV